jgi:hypothetical protein
LTVEPKAGRSRSVVRGGDEPAREDGEQILVEADLADVEVGQAQEDTLQGQGVAVMAQNGERRRP